MFNYFLVRDENETMHKFIQSVLMYQAKASIDFHG